MAPPFMMANRRGRRGPPPFIVQLLRAPLTLNNIIALIITKSVQHSRRAIAPENPGAGGGSTPFHPHGPFKPGGPGGFGFPGLGADHPHPPPGFGPGPGHSSGIVARFVGGHHSHGPAPPCAAKMFDHLLSVLLLLFIISTVHNILTVMRMHRIRKSVFGESMCAQRRRWRRGEMSEEEREACGEKMREMGKRMPSVWIGSADVILSIGFFGLWLLTVLLGGHRKVELGFAYASVGALVAFILNMMIGVNGLKMWARNKRQQKEQAVVVEEAPPSYADEKVGLLEN